MVVPPSAPSAAPVSGGRTDPPAPGRHRVPVSLGSVERASGALATRSIAVMHERLPWFSAMPAEHRAAVGLVAQAGIRSFVAWTRDPVGTRGLGADVFGAAPRDLLRVVSLGQVVELVRVAVEVVEEAVPELAGPDGPEEEARLREAVLRYSRELAFAAAALYAGAAEERGAWDARLEALIVDGVLRGDSDDSLPSRAAALGWDAPAAVAVVVGTRLDEEPEAVVAGVHRTSRAHRLPVLAGVHGERLVVVAGSDRPMQAALALLGCFGAGPVVVGPPVADLRSAPVSAQAALAGHAAVAGWPGAPRPVSAQALLPERALAGDERARADLVEEVYMPLRDANPALLETVTCYLEQGRSLEATARTLFVHPNTVRYRLHRAADVCGFDATDIRDAVALQVALVLGRLAAVTPLTRVV